MLGQDVEAGAIEQAAVLRQRPVARMLHLVRRANQASGQQEVDARLQVREVRHRHQQLAAGRQHAVQLGQRLRLILVGQVLEHVEAQGAREAAVRERQRQQRSTLDVGRRVVGVDAFDRQASGELLDQHALAAAGVEDGRAGGQGVQPAADARQLGQVGREVVPGAIGGAVVVAALGVFTRSVGGRHSGGCDGLYGLLYLARSGSTGVPLLSHHRRRHPVGREVVRVEELALGRRRRRLRHRRDARLRHHARRRRNRRGNRRRRSAGPADRGADARHGGRDRRRRLPCCCSRRCSKYFCGLA